jgi:glycosyltransferase involved in cell wall biosynthesis
MTNQSTCIFTIASKNYLGQVRCLLSSVKQHHPEAQLFLVLCDRVDGYFAPEAEGFQVIAAEDLGIERFHELAFKYNCVELNTAIKPFAIRHFFTTMGFDQVVYFDPDIIVYRRLDELFTLLQSHDVVLTPHITDFLPDDGCLPDNLRILQTGTNNLGFVALRQSERGMAMVDWWCRQLHERCRHAIDEGMFVDQKWMDLVYPCVESAAILRHPGYNTAYWNLSQRRITRSPEGSCLVNGQPLAFFHFSGYNPDKPSVISKYQTRLTWRDLGNDGQALFDDYRQRLLAQRFRDAAGWPYAFGCFENGIAVPDCFRVFFYKHLAGHLPPGSEVFRVSSTDPTVFSLFQSPLQGGLLTTAALALHEFHPDLQRAFPEVPGKDELNYVHWFVHPNGGVERLAEPFIEPVRARLPIAPPVPPPVARSPRVNRFAARMAKKAMHFAGRRRNLVNLLPRQVRYRTKRLLERMAYRDPAQLIEGTVPVAQSPARVPGVNFFGLLDLPTGVGEAARGMAACLERLQVPVQKLAFAEQHLFFGQPLPAETRPDPTFTINYCHVNADSTTALRQLFGEEAFAERVNIGFWAWELDDFPPVWDKAFAAYDEIWVPSTFVQQAVAARASVPVICMPHCIQVSQGPRKGRSAFGIPEDRTAILCMFDTASYTERKNPMAAIHAVKRACAGGPAPLLVIKVARPELHAGLLERLRAETQNLNCLIVEDWLSREDTWSLIDACDMFVSLHRAEGFGLILAEAMALGKPVVATGYSGNMDFMNSMNSFPVDYALTTLEQDIGPYPAGSHWAEPDLNHAAGLIRDLLENPDKARRAGQRAAMDIARTLSVDAVARRVQRRLTRFGIPVAEDWDQQLANRANDEKDSTRKAA